MSSWAHEDVARPLLLILWNHRAKDASAYEVYDLRVICYRILGHIVICDNAADERKRDFDEDEISKD